MSYGFAAGFIAVLVFHQGAFTLLHAIGMIPRPPFPVAPTAPFGVLKIWSLAFWGGVWGVIYAAVDRRFPAGAGYWIVALAFGALLPSLVAWLVVAPIHGQPVAGGWQPAHLAVGLIINGAWGVGTGLLLRVATRSGAAAATG